MPYKIYRCECGEDVECGQTRHLTSAGHQSYLRWAANNPESANTVIEPGEPILSEFVAKRTAELVKEQFAELAMDLDRIMQSRGHPAEAKNAAGDNIPSPSLPDSPVSNSPSRKAQWGLQKVVCECGGQYLKAHRAKHFRTQKHVDHVVGQV